MSNSLRLLLGTEESNVITLITGKLLKPFNSAEKGKQKYSFCYCYHSFLSTEPLKLLWYTKIINIHRKKNPHSTLQEIDQSDEKYN